MALLEVNMSFYHCVKIKIYRTVQSSALRLPENSGKSSPELHIRLTFSESGKESLHYKACNWNKWFIWTINYVAMKWWRTSGTAYQSFSQSSLKILHLCLNNVSAFNIDFHFAAVTAGSTGQWSHNHVSSFTEIVSKDHTSSQK